MGFKVGDKVRVKSNLIVGKSYAGIGGIEDTFVAPMDDVSGKVVTITDKRSGLYFIDESRGWAFTDEMFEPVQEVVPEPIPTPISKAEKTKIEFIATSITHFIVIGDVTICIPLDCPVGVAVKHPNDEPDAEFGMALAQFRMFNDAEANDLL